VSNWVEGEKCSDVPVGELFGASVEGVNLVVVRHGDQHSMMYGGRMQRGALLADGHIVGDDLICGVHGWNVR
jgi:methylamine---glutamate N-methyltransferase subunit C